MIFYSKTIRLFRFWDIYKGGDPWWLERKRKKVPGFTITNYKERVQRVKEIEELILRYRELQSTPIDIEGTDIIDGDHRLTAISNLIKKGKIKSIKLNTRYL